MKCLNCNSELMPNSKFCSMCGKKVIKCDNPGCGYGPLPDVAKYCPACGIMITSIIAAQTFEVVLKSCGSSKLMCVKLIKEFAGIDLQSAKDIVDNVPCIIKKCHDHDKAEVENLIKQLQEYGAKAEIVK